MADVLQVTPHTVKIWLRRGLLRGHPYSDKNESLYALSYLLQLVGCKVDRGEAPARDALTLPRGKVVA
jgi:hypothetical protein